MRLFYMLLSAIALTACDPSPTEGTLTDDLRWCPETPSMGALMIDGGDLAFVGDAPGDPSLPVSADARFVRVSDTQVLDRELGALVDAADHPFEPGVFDRGSVSVVITPEGAELAPDVQQHNGRAAWTERGDASHTAKFVDLHTGERADLPDVTTLRLDTAGGLHFWRDSAHWWMPSPDASPVLLRPDCSALDVRAATIGPGVALSVDTIPNQIWSDGEGIALPELPAEVSLEGSLDALLDASQRVLVLRGTEHRAHWLRLVRLEDGEVIFEGNGQLLHEGGDRLWVRSISARQYSLHLLPIEGGTPTRIDGAEGFEVEAPGWLQIAHERTEGRWNTLVEVVDGTPVERVSFDLGGSGAQPIVRCEVAPSNGLAACRGEGAVVLFDLTTGEAVRRVEPVDERVELNGWLAPRILPSGRVALIATETTESFMGGRRSTFVARVLTPPYQPAQDWVPPLALWGEGVGVLEGPCESVYVARKCRGSEDTRRCELRLHNLPRL